MRAADRSRRGWKGRRSLQRGSGGFTTSSVLPFGGVKGVARVGDEVTFVLPPFDEAEACLLPDLISRAADAVEEIVERGVASAMNRFNVWKQSGACGGPAETTGEGGDGGQSTGGS